MTSSPAAIRVAATVVLLRDGPQRLEVFLIQRVDAMAFAGGMTAFPGGGVDASDEEVVRRRGPDDAWWAHHLDTDEEQARTVLVAAARELFEETGVLLAGSRAGDAALVEAVAAHRMSLATVLGERELRADLLRPFARWLTPVGQPRRYDTFFLLAAQPAGAQARLLTTEGHIGSWWTPHAALAAARRGELAMLPPTVAMLSDLRPVRDVQAALDLERTVRALAPQVISSIGEPIRVRVGDREVAAIGALTP